MTSFTLPIPTYQCHKRVQALRIKAVVPNPRGYELHFEDERFCPVQFETSFNFSFDAEPGCYMVIEEGKPPAYVDAAAFEAGYTLVETADGAVRSPEWPKLDKPAMVGEARFGKGVSTRIVVEAAQRRHAENVTPEKEAERIARFRDGLAEIQSKAATGAWSAFAYEWPGGPSEVEAALASRDEEIERLRAKLDENAMPDDYILIADQLTSERLEKNRLREALALAEGVALRVIAETGFDESKVADWRPVVRDALRPVGPATQAAREVWK